ncbi:MAG: amidohydrolase family protein [Patescibacteria group bacterium]
MDKIIRKNANLFDALKMEVDPEIKRQSHTRYTILKPGKKARRILISSAAFIVTVDSKNQLQVWKNYSVYIVDGKIKEILPPGKKSIPLNKIDLIYDGAKRGGIVVTPGFINVHTHPPMYLLRSSMTLDKGNIVDQVVKMAQLEKKMTAQDFVLGAIGDFTEEQKNGITTTLSHYAVFDSVEQAAKLTKQYVINALSVVSNSHPKNSPEMAEKILENRKKYFSHPAIAIHYIHKADEEQLAKIKTLVKKYNVILTMHAAETEEWVQECVKKFGKRTVEVLVDRGLAGPNLILSHGVHFSDEEIKLVKKYKIGVVHLPTSNKLHLSGEFKYPLFVKYKADQQIALGTDSVISKNSLDLLSEALQARIMHQSAHRVLYEDLFKMMTCQAADVLRLNKVGKILPGYKADLAFWKLRDRGFVPYNGKKPISLVGNMITHGGRNIRDLMINGEFIISNRVHNLIDESQLMDELQKAHTKLRNKIE